ncbi:MAG: HD domain-containing protein [Candidatus Saccharibacteria bacterium]|nr:HD domain-containing protein [Candidatus Saccharibacteria bacterium]
MTLAQRLHNCIVRDPEWHAWADIIETHTIQEAAKFGCDHGPKHWTSVADLARNFVLNTTGSYNDAILADVAGLLHDCGRICGNERHPENGAQIARAFLMARFNKPNELADPYQPRLSDSDIDTICHAIANHSNGQEINTIVDVAVFFADKIDVTRDRDRVHTSSSIISEQATKIKRVYYEITDSSLVLHYETSGDFDSDVFFRWRKAYDAPAAAAKFISKNLEFYIDNKRFNLPTPNTAP